MADRIVRGYWDCPYCDSTDIDGLVDNCQIVADISRKTQNII